MSNTENRRSVKPTFSLLNLLTLTALVALGTAIGLAYRKNRVLSQKREDLLLLSSRLRIENDMELASAAMARVADDFYSWQVHVPAGADYELRLGMGAISENGIPPIVGSLRIPAGQHRVTLHTGDSAEEEFRYVVYVDGEQAIEQTMGKDWIPGGWSSSQTVNWPSLSGLTPAPRQLYAVSYRPNLDFGNGNYFNGQSDNYVTRTGIRLWLDRADRTMTPPSPFIGFLGDGGYDGIGFRDGLRYRSSVSSPYDWTFTRPQLDTIDPVLRIITEFIMDDGSVLSSQTQSFQSWQLRNDDRGAHALKWQADPPQSVYSAFLQARVSSDDALQVIVEIKWDQSRPDEVGLRLADSPANDRVKQWRLRVLDGTKHLWRELLIGDRMIKADSVIDDSQTKPSDVSVKLDLGDSPTEDTLLQWQTEETLPLQVVERKQPHYAGMGLYNGLPAMFAIEIPASLKPTLDRKSVV